MRVSCEFEDAIDIAGHIVRVRLGVFQQLGQMGLSRLRSIPRAAEQRVNLTLTTFDLLKEPNHLVVRILGLRDPRPFDSASIA